MSTLLNSCLVVLVNSPSAAMRCAWASCWRRASTSSGGEPCVAGCEARELDPASDNTGTAFVASESAFPAGSVGFMNHDANEGTQSRKTGRTSSPSEAAQVRRLADIACLARLAQDECLNLLPSNELTPRLVSTKRTGLHDRSPLQSAASIDDSLGSARMHSVEMLEQMMEAAERGGDAGRLGG